jgi:hypothetical protein
MPLVGISLYLLVAIFFAVHAVRRGRNLVWLFVLFSFPLLGSLVYFVVEYLPEVRVQRNAQRAVGRAASLLDPERGVREARAAVGRVPSVQNQLRLAHALLERGSTHEAVQQFEACLAGPGGRDPEVRYATAIAQLRDGQAGAALSMARELRAEHPIYQPERVALLLAQALWNSGERAMALAEFSSALERFGSTEVRGRYAIFAAQSGDLSRAQALAAELNEDQKHWPSHTRDLNRQLLREVAQAVDAARAPGKN